MAMKYSIGAEELKGRGNNLYKAIFAEFFGIFILNFFGCAACVQSGGDKVLISLAFGLSVFMAAMVSQLTHAIYTNLSLSSLKRM
jgi:aquaporin rerated protein, invertebrate